MKRLKVHAFETLVCLFFTLILVACNTHLTPDSLPPSPAVYETFTGIVTPEPTNPPTCYQAVLPADIANSYAIQGWQEYATQIGISLRYFYFPEDCPVDHLEQESQEILYGDLIPEDQVGLVILNPVDSGTFGAFYRHLIEHEYWQMGPEDYPALLEDKAAVNKNLVFLRFNELNGDDTIIGDPLTVLASLAEHEYIHIAQSRNNPDLADMVWADKDYQFFIEGYANIGNASSQRYYFETKSAIEILQNLDQLNRSGNLCNPISTKPCRSRERMPLLFLLQIPGSMTAISWLSSCGWAGKLMWMYCNRARSAHICYSAVPAAATWWPIRFSDLYLNDLAAV